VFFAVMEVLFGIIVSGCFGYLITEVNQLQSQVNQFQREMYEFKILLNKISRLE
jgi:hypothetical protein